MTEILLVVNLVFTLLIVLAVGYVWNFLKSLSVVTLYNTMFLQSEFEEYGTQEFEETK